MDDPHADLPAQGHGSHPRVPVPGRGRGGERSLRARSEDVVRDTMTQTMTRTWSRRHTGAAVAALVAVAAVIAATSSDGLGQSSGDKSTTPAPGPIRRMSDGKPDLSGHYV